MVLQHLARYKQLVFRLKPAALNLWAGLFTINPISLIIKPALFMVKKKNALQNCRRFTGWQKVILRSGSIHQPSGLFAQRIEGGLLQSLHYRCPIGFGYLNF